MALVTLLLVTLTMGVVEFGRMLMILNIITNATRDAARAASAMGKTDRSATTSHICSTREDAVKDMVVNQVNNYVTITRSNVTVEYPAPASGAPQTVRVRTSVPVPYIALFNLVGSNLNVDKTVSFRDEFTAPGSGC